MALLMISGSSEASASSLEQALKFYSAGNFAKAKAIFLKRVEEDPSDPRVHYCLANTLLQLKDIPEALSEYHHCLELGPSKDIYEKCHRVISSIEIPLKRAREEYKMRIDVALARIEKQAAHESDRRAEHTEKTSKVLLDRAQIKAKEISETAKQQAEDWIERSNYNLQSYEDAAEMRSAAKAHAETVVTRAIIQSKGHEKALAETQTGLKSTAANLQSHFRASSRIRLVPEGTNLYIRTYGN